MYYNEVKRRGLSCGVSGTKSTQIATLTTNQSNTAVIANVLDQTNPSFFANMDNKYICMIAKNRNGWSKTHPQYVQEAKRRGLTCGVGGTSTTQIASSNSSNWLVSESDSRVCGNAVLHDGSWRQRSNLYVQEAKRRGLSCGVGDVVGTKMASANATSNLTSKVFSWSCGKSKHVNWVNWELDLEEGELRSNYELPNGENTTQLARVIDANDEYVVVQDFIESEGWNDKSWDFRYSSDNITAIYEGKLFDYGDCTKATVLASSTTPQSSTPTSAELEAERQKRIKLEQQLAALKAQQEQQQQTISNDTKLPTITIASATAKGAQGIIRGRVNDNTGIAELRVDGQKIAVDSSGNFSATTYVPEGGTSANIEAIDLAGLSSTMSVRVDRAATQTASISFDRLNPLKRKAAINNDALALVIGVSDYKETNAKAVYADSDAKVFQDYAIEKLGVPRSRVKTLVNDGADEKDMLLATKRWLARAAKQGKTDVYIFFAGHGLASDDGSKMYLLPYDGAPELLDDTAILRDRLFSDVAAANPRSVTVFLDTCYSGTTRGTDMLIASRPIAIRALEQSIPDNFTVMTAAAGDQTAKPLEEAKHGMFSYFLMKGMEGEADADKNNEISAGELHSYVQTNVIQQSSGSQTPELQGDADRVLVRFQ
jgi:uncharacterized caspase-like protein